MKKSLNRILSLIIVLLCSNISFAQQDAGQPGEFLRYGVNARALGMGRAFTAVTDNANAVYWNPGGLYDLVRDGLSLSLMYSKMYESTNYNFAAVALPLELLVSADVNSGFGGEMKKWNLGFGYLGLTSDGFEMRDRFNQTSGESFSDAQTALFFTATRAFTFRNHRFGLGVNYKLLTHKMFDQKANTAAIDIGIKYQPPVTWLVLAANLQNMNSPDFHFAQGGADQIPHSVRLGLALLPETGQKFLDSFLFSFDFMAVPPGKRTPDWFAGVEYDLSSIVANLPVKLRFGLNSRESYTFGINLDLPNNAFFTSANQVLPKLDWAYLPNQNLLGNVAERFSMDFSYTPFTGERWYKRGLEKLDNKQYFLARENLTRAISAKNPNRLGYPESAILRLGDLEVLAAKDKFAGLKAAIKYYRRVPESGSSKGEIDADRNRLSYLNFLQGLYLEKKYDDIVRYTTKDVIWTNHNTRKDEDKIVAVFRSWAYYLLNDNQKAMESLSPIAGYSLGDILMALLNIRDGKYQEARDLLQEIIDGGPGGIPDNIYVSPFDDHLILDDAQFLLAYAGVKLAEKNKTDLNEQNLLEFGEIQRFYPLSDMNRYLQANGQFEEIISTIESNDNDVINIDRIFENYLNTLHQGFVSGPSLIANLR